MPWESPGSRPGDPWGRQTALVKWNSHPIGFFSASNFVETVMKYVNTYLIHDGWLMLIDGWLMVDWCWLMLIDVDWCWLMLIDHWFGAYSSIIYIYTYVYWRLWQFMGVWNSIKLEIWKLWGSHPETFTSWKHNLPYVFGDPNHW
jgi:hypothetical protein